MKVLVADDDAASRIALTGLLRKWGYEVTAVGDGDAAWGVLTAPDGPRLAILDWMMPGREGPEICAELRRSQQARYFYVILLTALDQQASLVTGMDSGADDYIVKPFRPEELRVRLRAGRRILDLEAELTASREAFRELAARDALTGVFSRRAILDTLSRELSRGRRAGTPVSVALCDADHFKRINDTHGHAVGDAVLVELARRMASALRDSDAIGRIGGEEFLALLPGADRESALSAAERVRAAVAAAPVETSAGPIPLTVSIGVAMAPDGTVAPEALTADADRALYRAKEEGRDRVRFLDPAVP